MVPDKNQSTLGSGADPDDDEGDPSALLEELPPEKLLKTWKLERIVPALKLTSSRA